MKTTGFRRYAGWFVRLFVLVAAVATGREGLGQALPVQITEIMNDPNNEDAWEWIEVRNTGAIEVDLDNYIIERLGDAKPSTVSANISSLLSTNTKIPAGGVAILYDGDGPISAADYNDGLFRQAWGLSPTVQLIGVSFNFGGGLTNGGGTSLGFYPTVTAYEADLQDDGMGVLRLAQFDNSAFNIDFRNASGFPQTSNGKSIAWNGTGSYQAGANWAETTTGVTSVAATVPGSTNSALDVGNPGVRPPTGVAPAGALRFTEIMYNPNSADASWEWVELYNNTGSTLNFNTTPGVFDDDDDGKLAAANITSGIIPNGTTAVLFKGGTGGVTISDMQAAWDPNGTRGTNFIPVNGLTELGNPGDMIALWTSYNAYNTEATTGQGRTFANAVGFGGYDDDEPNQPLLSGSWVNSNGRGSISLVDLSADPLVADNWSFSVVGDASGSFTATAIAGTITVHPGGDLGTPGVVGSTLGPNANFNATGVVDNADLTIWKTNYHTGTTQPLGDADRDGDVDGSDFLVWQRQAGTTPASAAAAAGVPEPATSALALVGLMALAGLRRRSAA